MNKNNSMKIEYKKTSCSYLIFDNPAGNFKYISYAALGVCPGKNSGTYDRRDAALNNDSAVSSIPLGMSKSNDSPGTIFTVDAGGFKEASRSFLFSTA